VFRISRFSQVFLRYRKYMDREQSLARKHLKRAPDLNPTCHPVHATVAKDTLKQLVALSSQGNKDRGAEIGIKLLKITY